MKSRTKPIINETISNGNKVRFTWMYGADFTKYAPITQSYGIVFDTNGNIVLVQWENGEWGLPGGTPEKGETPLDTLNREFMEEVDIEIKNPILLGVQKAELIGKKSACVYQVRFVGLVKRIHAPTPDPDGGLINKRKFVNHKLIKKYINWGATGDKMFNDSIFVYKNKLLK